MEDDFGEWLKAAMEEKDVTVRGLARTMASNEGRAEDTTRVEHWRTMIGRYRRGANDPEVETREALARALGVELSDIPPRRRRVSATTVSASLDELAEAVTLLARRVNSGLEALETRIAALEQQREQKQPRSQATSRRKANG